VQLRVRRRGATVRARTGYWTATADELLRARMAAKAAEPKPPPEPPLRASPLIRPWFGVTRATDGKVQVSFVWEPAGRGPGDPTGTQLPACVELKATRDGATVFEGRVRPSQGATNDAATTPAEAVFEVAPGRLRVQMTIEDATERFLDSDVRDVVVGSLGGQVALGTPQVLRARNAREFREQKANPDAAPVAAREFSRTERLLVRVPAYGQNGPPTITVRLLARGGNVMRELPVETQADGTYQVDVPLAGLAPGEYSLELVAQGEGAESKDTLRFRVTS